MTQLVVNGRSCVIGAPPRAHLADVLRDELLLTGTHIGCEHGVCGACTVLINDEPARACLAFPALCAGASVRTIEGLDDDPTIAALRAAFKAEHALQCGYCTPGMLVTARDIVLRLPQADEARVRLELSGSLCRCTGYQGIVQAILRVLASPPAATQAPPPAALPHAPTRGAAVPRPAPETSQRPRGGAPEGRALHLRQALSLSADALWGALQDPALLVGCVPGAKLTSVEGDVLSGELLAGLGPVRTRFTGKGRLDYDEAARSARLEGEGQDRLSATRAGGRIDLRVLPEPEGSSLEISADYSLRGPLAQLARPGIVAAFAEELVENFARRLEAALGVESAARPTQKRRGAVWRNLLRRLIGRHV